MKLAAFNQVSKYIADTVYSTATDVDWKAAGQWIVYGLESKIGFHRSTELCGILEKLYNKKATRSITELETATRNYLKTFITIEAE